MIIQIPNQKKKRKSLSASEQQTAKSGWQFHTAVIMITTSTVLPSNPSTCYCSNTRFVTEVTSALFNNACRVCTSPLCPKASQTRPPHLDIGSDSTLTLVRSVCKDILSKRRALRRLATNIFDPVGRIAKLKTHDCRPTFVVRGSLRLRRDLLSPSYDNLLLKDLVHSCQNGNEWPKPQVWVHPGTQNGDNKWGHRSPAGHVRREGHLFPPEASNIFPVPRMSNTLRKKSSSVLSRSL